MKKRYPRLYDTVYKRYADYEKKTYPIEQNGFCKSFDSVTEEETLFETFIKYGIVVGKAVISRDQCSTVIDRINHLSSIMSNGRFNINNVDTYNFIPVDNEGTPLISRGFFEIYHDDCLANIRQSIRLYLHHVIIWGGPDLWTTFDRLGVKLPFDQESKALSLHVDQNYSVHPNFRTIQGVLALSDCPLDQGTYRAIPGSKSFFEEYNALLINRPEYKGEYVEASFQKDVLQRLESDAQSFPLQAGDIVTWDSRTTHANTSNRMNKARYVAYIAAGPNRADLPESNNARQISFSLGEGKNIRDALMHASKPPRYNDNEKRLAYRNPEHFNWLGEKLYGISLYD